jgi:hypothetical protein
LFNAHALKVARCVVLILAFGKIIGPTLIPAPEKALYNHVPDAEMTGAALIESVVNRG